LAWILFFIALVPALLAPPAIAVPAMVVLAHLDMSGANFAAADTLGIANLVRSFFVPIIIFRRFCVIDTSRLVRDRLTLWWVCLTLFAAIASFWSPVKLPAAKMIAYLVSYFLIFAILRTSWRRGWLNSASIFWILCCAVFIAIVQTNTGNYFGAQEEFVERFSSFATPQSFAAFIVSCFAILIFSDLSWLHYKLPASLISIYSVYKTGSRYCFVGLVIVIAVFAIRAFLQSQRKARLVVAGALLAICGFASVPPDSRVGELINGDIFSNSIQEQLESISTFYWRINLYAEAVSRIENRIAERDFFYLAFGSGTSTGGEILEAGDPDTYARFQDNNRSVHDEFLRAVYEWGVLGVALLCLILAELLRLAIAEARKGRYAPISIFPLLMIGLLIENILAGSSGPNGVGFALVFSMAQVPTSSVVKQTLPES
jgi:hypothetical protein